MKKIKRAWKRKLRLGFISFLLIGLSSCDYLYEYIEITTDIEAGVYGVYNSEDDFVNNSNAIDISKYVFDLVTNEHSKVTNEHNHPVHYMGGWDGKEVNKVFADLRSDDGWSNWANSGSQGAKWLRHEVHSSSATEYDEYYGVQFEMKTPPVQLHMVLNNSVDEILEVGSPANKSWKVAKIEDVDGNSLENDPDWKHYIDDVFTYEKGGKLSIAPGELRSANEKKYLGSINANGKYYGGYLVGTKENISEFNDEMVNVSHAKVKYVFPNYQIVAEIIESDFQHIKIRPLENAKGILFLVPVN